MAVTRAFVPRESLGCVNINTSIYSCHGLACEKRRIREGHLNQGGVTHVVRL